MQHDYNNFTVKIVSDVIYLEILYLVSCWTSLVYKGTDCCSTIRSDAVLSPGGIKQLYFRMSDTKIVYGPKAFCLITGLNFREYPKNIEKIVSSKKRCLLRERLFPNHTNSSEKIGDLKSFILNQSFLEVGDADAVRVCLIYILCESFLGKEINDRVPQDWYFFVENLDVWNSFAWGAYL
uniref:DUF1985 domain-containing protein n=1 Tax=Lactuca sativa TaxID=4236 RepID=A0A9R1XFI2_LACSA|nr:hypothetical protein LSAT_V11C400214090 [Lactuca sativa]